MMTPILFAARRRARSLVTGGAVALAALLAAAITGCGGVGTGGASAARIRAIDAATNAATADVLVNNASAYGDLMNGSTTPYLYVGSSTTSSFTYTTTTPLSTNSINLTTENVALADGQFYTAFLAGRPDVAKLPNGLPDARFLKVYVTNDAKPTLTTGQAAVRVFDAAPDQGPINVFGLGAAALPVAYATASAYQVIPAGALNVAAGNASCTDITTCTGSALFLPNTSVTVTAGQSYTLVVTEPTAPTGTPSTGAFTYALLTFTD